MALATPAQAADDGIYRIRDARTSHCLVGGYLESCDSYLAVWDNRNQGDGRAQISGLYRQRRCPALSPAQTYPPSVFVAPCGILPDRWTIQGQPGEGPVAIALERGELGYLTTQGNRAVVDPYGGPQWVLERLG